MPPHPPETIETVCRLKRQGVKFRDIGLQVGLSKEAARGIWIRHKHKFPANSTPTVTATGVTPADYLPDPQQTIDQAIADFDDLAALEAKRATQTISFSHGPACMVWVADTHFGGRGVNVRRALAEAETIASIPGVGVGFVGDARDSFIVGQLMRLLMGQELTIEKEMVLFREWLAILAPVLRMVVSGNHDMWAAALTGIPYLRDVAARIAPDCLYADLGTPLTIQVGQAQFPGMVRHDWPGNSQWNETHGIEKAFAMKWQHLRWAVGAHRHSGGIVRPSNWGGVRRVAGMCGTYKEIDPYAVKRGFGPRGESTAIGFVFHEAEDYIMGYDHLGILVHDMHKLYT